MSNDDTSYRAYREAVTSYAEEIRDAVRDGEDEYDATHERIDGSWWVIYTHANLAVLQHTQNDNAVFDVMGSDALVGCNSTGEVYARLAYWAMLTDVQEELARLEKETPVD